jgi:uncharacterized membrane protein
VSSKSRNRKSKASSTPARTVREEKRAQFEGKRSNNKLHVALAAGALVIVAIVAAVVVMNRGGGNTAAATAASSPAGNVTLPVSQANDGKAHFYTYDANGTSVKYFVLASKDGTVRAALDACEVCYPKKLGYHQVGDYMQCNNCGKQFRSDQINVVTGGCNPIPLTRSVTGSSLTIAASSLQAGAQYFQ